MASRTLKVELIGDASSLNRALGQAQSKTSRFGAIAKTALIGGAAAGMYALGKAAKIGWDEFNQGQKVAAQTNAVIKSTGGVANVTAQQVEDLGVALMKKSGIDDEAIKSGENMLLTFTNIRNEVGRGNDIFAQATNIMTDMSVALGQDTTQSAMQLGKALNDPIRGVTALRRVGVSFTDSQTEMIAKLVESGNTLDAQKVILQELNKEFGNSAEAAGKTVPGQIAILKESFNNWAGDMVAKAIPALTDFLGFLGDVRKAKSPTIAIRTVLKGAGTALEKLLFGSPATRVRVPIEGGRFEWQIRGGNQGLVAAVAKAIRDIDWREVGVAIQHGMQDAIDAAIPGLDPNKGLLTQKVGRDWVGGILGGFEDGFRSNGIDPNKGLLGQLFPDEAGFLNKQITVPKIGGIDLNKGLLENLGLSAEDAFAAVNKSIDSVKSHMGSTASATRTFSGAMAEHLDLVSSKTEKADSNIEQLRASVASLQSKKITVTANVVGLGYVAALQEHLSIIRSQGTNINVTASSAKAMGGPVTAGRSYLVGERGPELMVPNSNGRIIPNHKLSGSAGNGPMTVNLVLDRRVLASVLIDMDTDYRRRNGGRPLFA